MGVDDLPDLSGKLVKRVVVEEHACERLLVSGCGALRKVGVGVGVKSGAVWLGVGGGCEGAAAGEAPV